MQPGTVQVNARTQWVMSFAVATLLVLGLAGCAADRGISGISAGNSGDEKGPNVGVFTGEYVDGKPLYRFPAIYIVGLRRSADSD
jgi:hypothetical protein